MHFQLHYLRLGAVFASTIALATTAHAELPSGVSKDAFATACGELKAAAACDECECEVVTTTDGPTIDRETQPVIAYAMVVKVSTPAAAVTPGRTAPFISRLYMVVGSASELHNAGLLVNGDSAGGDVVYLELNKVKPSQFNDVCLVCDHENAGLVHVFDLTIEKTAIAEREDYEHWKTVEEMHELVTCFGPAGPQCFATPLGGSTITQREPQAPGDKPKPGKKSSWKRSWKIGGHNKMQVVLGPISGNLAAKTKKDAIGTDGNAFNFTDLPGRTSAKRLLLK